MKASPARSNSAPSFEIDIEVFDQRPERFVVEVTGGELDPGQADRRLFPELGAVLLERPNPGRESILVEP